MNDPSWIPINERYALYSFWMDNNCCTYIIDLSKPESGWIDRITEDNLRWTPKLFCAAPIDGNRFLKGFGFRPITGEQFFDDLKTAHPEVLEFLLFHPELL